MVGEALADDAAQAVFILFWQKGKKLSGEAALSSWLYRTAVHVCRNARRSDFARITHERKAAQVTPMSREDGDLSKWQEIRELLDEEVARLPEKWRIPFILFHLEHRSLAQISGTLGATTSTVGTWLKRGREQLAANLGRRGITISAAMLAATLSSHVTVQAVPPTFVTATIQAAHGFGLGGSSAASPLLASLVQSGTHHGINGLAWIRGALAFLLLLGIPIAAYFVFPMIQTRQSKDFPQLQGEWREVANEQDGALLTGTSAVSYTGTLIISGNQFHRFQTLPDGKVLQGGKGSIVLDDQANPKAIDFSVWSSVWFRQAHGVYELDQDQLTLCISRDGEARPDRLTTSKGDNWILTRYQRVK